MHFQMQKYIDTAQNAIYDYSLRENNEIIGKIIVLCMIYSHGHYVTVKIITHTRII